MVYNILCSYERIYFQHSDGIILYNILHAVWLQADDTLKYFFPVKNYLTFHANCLLRRQFVWSVRYYFLGKIRKLIISLSSDEFAHCIVSVNSTYQVVFLFPASSFLWFLSKGFASNHRFSISNMKTSFLTSHQIQTVGMLSSECKNQSFAKAFLLTASDTPSCKIENQDEVLTSDTGLMYLPSWRQLARNTEDSVVRVVHYTNKDFLNLEEN